MVVQSSSIFVAKGPHAEQPVGVILKNVRVTTDAVAATLTNANFDEYKHSSNTELLEWDLTGVSCPIPLFRYIHRFVAMFIAPTVISRAVRKLSHVSCTSNDVKIMNRTPNVDTIADTRGMA